MGLGYFLLLSLGLTAVSGQFLNCNWVNNLDCSSYVGGLMCGSNGQTYNNRCFLAKAQCADSKLRTVSEGACSSPTVTTSAPVVPVVTAAPNTGSTTTREPVFVNHNQLLDFFCLHLMHEPCIADTEPVCGTDGVTYTSFCEYEKQRCSHRTLMVKSFSTC